MHCLALAPSAVQYTLATSRATTTQCLRVWRPEAPLPPARSRAGPPPARSSSGPPASRGLRLLAQRMKLLDRLSSDGATTSARPPPYSTASAPWPRASLAVRVRTCPSRTPRELGSALGLPGTSARLFPHSSERSPVHALSPTGRTSSAARAPKLPLPASRPRRWTLALRSLTRRPARPGLAVTGSRSAQCRAGVAGSQLP